jgi:hypothetical protein
VSDKNLGTVNSYNVALNIQELSKVVDPFNEVKSKMQRELFDGLDEGERPDDALLDKANKDLVALSEEEVSVELKPLRLSDIPDGANLTPRFFVTVQSIVSNE